MEHTFEDQLAAAVELNSVEWMRQFKHLPWVEVHDDDDLFWCFAGDTWPGNSVAHARLKPNKAIRRIREILAAHWQHKVACNWVVGPISQPADLSKHLKDNGFSCRLHCAGMVCDLQTIQPRLPVPDGVTVELVENPPSLVPLTTDRRRKRHEGRNIIAKLNPRRDWYFAAYVDSQPVGETVLFEGSTAAGIYDVEVLESFRRRGIGSALVQAALSQAKKLRQPFAVLGATGMGSSVYQRHGFREICKISFWKYGKMRQL